VTTPNEPNALSINYYLREAKDRKVSIHGRGPGEPVVRTLTGTALPGLNTVRWDMRDGGGKLQPRGDYVVTVDIDGRTFARTARIRHPADDRARRRRSAAPVSPRQRAVTDGVPPRGAGTLRHQVARQHGALGHCATSPPNAWRPARLTRATGCGRRIPATCFASGSGARCARRRRHARRAPRAGGLDRLRSRHRRRQRRQLGGGRMVFAEYALQDGSGRLLPGAICWSSAATPRIR